MSNKYKDLTGKVFGKLQVVRIDHFQKTAHNTRVFWECKCDCGNVKVVRSDCLTSGNTQSCGCYNISCHEKPNSIKKHELYRVWWAMKQRCYNKSCKTYHRYGGREITICDEWLKSYEHFYNWAMETGYKKGLEIDRINNDGNYEPSNCRWSNRKEQTNNTSRNRVFEYNGQNLNISQWAKLTGISRNTLYGRLITYKWDVKRALTEPIHK